MNTTTEGFTMKRNGITDQFKNGDFIAPQITGADTTNNYTNFRRRGYSFNTSNTTLLQTNTSHTFTRPGYFTIGLTATNLAGASYHSEKIWVVQGRYPFSPFSQNSIVNCDDFTYTVRREIMEMERMKTDEKI